jgi:hypothetical protein
VVAAYPRSGDLWLDSDLDARMNFVKDIIHTARWARTLLISYLCFLVLCIQLSTRFSVAWHFTEEKRSRKLQSPCFSVISLFFHIFFISSGKDPEICLDEFHYERYFRSVKDTYLESKAKPEVYLSSSESLSDVVAVMEDLIGSSKIHLNEAIPLGNST